MGADASRSEQIIPDDLLELINQRDGAAKLTRILPQRYTCDKVAEAALVQGPDSPHHVWESCGFAYLSIGRVHESVAIFESLYDHLLFFQAKTGKRAHKGAPLVMLSECHAILGNPVIARRNLDGETWRRGRKSPRVACPLPPERNSRMQGSPSPAHPQHGSRRRRSIRGAGSGLSNRHRPVFRMRV